MLLFIHTACYRNLTPCFHVSFSFPLFVYESDERFWVVCKHPEYSVNQPDFIDASCMTRFLSNDFDNNFVVMLSEAKIRLREM